MSCNDSLIKASRDGNLEGVIVCLEAGADIHAEDDEALRWASENGHLDVVRCLLEAGANVHAENDKALYRAIQRNHFEIAEYLLVNKHDGYIYHSNSPLYISAMYERYIFVKLLLENGCIPSKEILLITVTNGNVRILEILLDYLNLDITGGEGGYGILTELLETAAYHSQFDIVKLLLDYGASPTSLPSMRDVKRVIHDKRFRRNIDNVLMKMYSYTPMNPRCVVF